MGFKDDVRDKAQEFERDLVTLKGRVTALERLAEQIKGSPISTPARRTEVAAARSEVSASPAVAPVVDYAAIAFGLSQIKAKVAQILPAGRESDMRDEWQGTVDWFADVFAKSDANFDRDAFNRAAQR